MVQASKRSRFTPDQKTGKRLISKQYGARAGRRIVRTVGQVSTKVKARLSVLNTPGDYCISLVAENIDSLFLRNVSFLPCRGIHVSGGRSPQVWRS